MGKVSLAPSAAQGCCALTRRLGPPLVGRPRRRRGTARAVAGWSGSHDLLPRALDWLNVMDAAPIPMRAEPTATRCGEMVEQVGHRVVGTVRGDEIVARKCSPPIALAA